MFLRRNLTEKILKSLRNNPVVLINGARQVGKSTLIEEIVKRDFSAHYISLDDHSVLFASLESPLEFLNGYGSPVAIDEVQRNTELFMAIKRIVDTRKKTGQFILTGSANVLTLPKVSESLAGRMIIHSLWPLSQGEIRGSKEGFIDWAFTGDGIPIFTGKIEEHELIDMIMKGGYPRSLFAEDQRDRMEWFGSYVDTILQRDILNLARIEGLIELPNVLSVIAERVGNLVNLADIGRMTKINKVTLKRYYTLLKMVFLVVEVPAWFTNREKRLVKSPKVYLNDTALVCYFKQLAKDYIMTNRLNLGSLLENFCLMELKKQATWSEIKPEIFHYRTQAGSEVDIVLEGPNKEIVGIEVKGAGSINKGDLAGMKSLKDTAGDRFRKGIILYTGEHALPLARDIFALPINALWEIGSSTTDRNSH